MLSFLFYFLTQGGSFESFVAAILLLFERTKATAYCSSITMPQLHQLTLPLPLEYRSAENTRGEYTVFSDTNTECLIPELLQRYLTDLIDFLAFTKLIQRHPDDFFDFFGPYATEGAFHMDGTVIKSEEKKNISGLCADFHPLFDSNSAEDCLSDIVLNGPPESFTTLRKFFKTTRRLQLNRHRHQSNNGISFTTKNDNELLQCTSGIKELNAKQQKTLDLVLRYGMSTKKQHEVEIMCHSVNELTQCCSPALHSDCSDSKIRTVINIGEGKGYVSRGLSLVCGLQVIGLDCNPSHKKKMVERTDELVETSLNVSKRKISNPSSTSCTSLNLLYEPRGYLTSIVCTVQKSIDWPAVLKGFSLTVDSFSGEKSAENDVTCSVESEDDSSPSETLVKLCNMEHKMKCNFCGRIVRRSVVQLSRHVHEHVRKEEILPSLGVAIEEVNEWNRTLPPDAFTQRLIESYFTSVNDTALPIQHPFEGNLKLQKSAELCNLSLTPVYVARGYRVELLLSSSCHLFEETNRRLKHEKDSNGVSCSCISMKKKICTILGYDDASNLHTLKFDSVSGSFRMLLVHNSTRPNDEKMCLDDNITRMLSEFSIGIVTHVFPPVAPTKRYVDVPLLRNTVMIGLHTCGDLGSNVCRIFSNSGSRGLLLVSCCWHALTSEGFPLSNFFRRNGASINKISLLLATQPFDMWGANNSKGHRGSAKLLFFRSLLKLFWGQLKLKWEGGLLGSRPPCCSFAPLPHLEPFFLRLMASKKHEMNFSFFFYEVLKYFVFEESMRRTAYTWDKCVCFTCRSAQEAFFREQIALQAEKDLETKLFKTCFPAFLGLTVLRMWMCHTVESYLLMDRTLFLFEQSFHSKDKSFGQAVSLFPLFDGKISPRLFAICARRF